MAEVAEPRSPRLAVVIREGRELIRVGAELGATRVALCGSVARGHDDDHSDIDFYVFDFRLTESLDDRIRADRLVREYRRLLRPYEVDVRGIPGWLLDPPHEASMRRDSIDLSVLSSSNGRGRPRRVIHAATGSRLTVAFSHVAMGRAIMKFTLVADNKGPSFTIDWPDSWRIPVRDEALYVTKRMVDGELTTGLDWYVVDHVTWDLKRDDEVLAHLGEKPRPPVLLRVTTWDNALGRR